MPESSLDSNDLYNWVIFFISFIETSKNSKSFIELKKINNRKDFLKIVGVDSDLEEEFNYWLESRFEKFKNRSEKTSVVALNNYNTK
jgi:hypothetical protein